MEIQTYDKLRVIITGVTGMVGEGVLHECINHAAVEKILIVGRRPYEISNPKVSQIIHSDFYDLAKIETDLTGYNACFFCLGVSSVGLTEEQYRKSTYDLTMTFAKTLVKQNPDMIFGYISGSGTDSTEKGKLMWARVKGKTENDLMKLPFKRVYNFRPGFMKPTPGLKNMLKPYKYLSWLFPILNLVSSNLASTLAEMGMAMINSVYKGDEKQILEVRDIVMLARKK